MPKFIDLTGQRFGKLLVVSRAKNDKTGHVWWNCVCDCGKNTSVRAISLRNGDTKRCGQKGCLRLSFKDLTGQRFGKLLVVSKAKNRDGQHENFWNCVCDCGHEFKAPSYSLRRNITVSCPSCAKRVFVDLTGKRFGKITVISLHVEKYKRTRWDCLCDCGNKMVVTSNNLNSGTKSCVKCAIKRLPEDTLSSKHALYSNYRSNARNRNIPFHLTFDEFISITQRNCYYCGKPPSQYFLSTSKGIFYNGIDRVNSDEGV